MAGQQISIEAAYDEVEAKAVELFKENLLLRARLRELTAELERRDGQAPTGPGEAFPAGPVEERG